MTQSAIGQYDKYSLAVAGGTSFSRYIGNGKADNYFNFSNPYQGYQFELIINDLDGLEWILYGMAHIKTFNYSSYYPYDDSFYYPYDDPDNYFKETKVPVEFWIPYYTELLFYQSHKKNPLFIILGYDYVRMRFHNMEKHETHHNLSIGGGWNLKLSDPLYLQFKFKPYYIIENSLGQKFGLNVLINLHFGIIKKD